jgi:glutamate dehydrogenase (NADP+)
MPLILVAAFPRQEAKEATMAQNLKNLGDKWLLIGVGGREISYLFGQYKRMENRFTGVLTGKGLAFGGSLIRTEATGYGAVYFIQNVLQAHSDSVEDKTCSVSGSGNVAIYAIEKLNHLGAKVLTASDSGGFILDPAGIDEEKLAWIKELKEVRRGRISEYAEHFSGASYHEGKRPWGVPVDLAFPCATQNELNGEDAKALIENGIRGVAEGANMPSTVDAVNAFLAARVHFGPAKAANAGGVAVSGLEQSQNSLRISWSREEVDERLKGIMRSIYARCAAYGLEEDGFINMVKGANIGGFIKVADAMVAYGAV